MQITIPAADMRPQDLADIAALHEKTEPRKRVNLDDLLRIPEGQTCGDCHHFRRCEMLFMCQSDWTTCDFHPVRFMPREDRGPCGAD